MMHKYCLDTSGFSNPLMDQPERIYVTLWPKVTALIAQGMFCWNEEIAIEIDGIYGQTGEELRSCKSECCFEIGKEGWNWQEYLVLVDDWQNKYRDYISEYNRNRKNTISLTDLSIVAMAKIVDLPVISMEKRNTSSDPSSKKMRIPDLCDQEGVEHFSFLEFLTAEKITV